MKKILTITFLLSLLLVSAPAYANPGQGEGLSRASEVKSELSKIASKNNKISEDLKNASDGLDDVDNKIDSAKKGIENRSKLKTFLVGTNYKNLGQLRSTIVTIQNQIDRLVLAKSKTTDAATIASIDAQIAKLTAVQQSAQTFIKTNESKFSLFGWVSRLFTKKDTPKEAPLQTNPTTNTSVQTPTVKPVTPAPTTTTNTVKTFTLADVAKHAVEGDCYTVINNNVYDLTAWVKKHPGGDRNILRICGIDGTSAFTGKHGGQALQEKILNGFQIGTLIK